jgi:uncharacterized pyridoxamine 5'-phosphate oxidase family protein
MDSKATFSNVMAASMNMALATATDNMPKVRIVSFMYDETAKTVYIATFSGSSKTLEFAKNENVAFTTIPKDGESHVRVRSAIAKKSALGVADVKDRFIAKMPMFEGLFGQFAGAMEIWEISFTEADVIENAGNEVKITI